MSVKEKLSRLLNAEPTVLYRYVALAPRVDQRFFYLDKIRLQVFRFGGKQISFTEAAPVVETDKGRQKILFCDSGVTELSKGILAEHEGRLAAHVSYIFGTESITDQRYAVMANMAQTPALPLVHIQQPLYARLTKDVTGDIAVTTFDGKARGGMICVSDIGIDRQTVKSVFTMSYKKFKDQLKALQWRLKGIDSESN